MESSVQIIDHEILQTKLTLQNAFQTANRCNEKAIYTVSQKSITPSRQL